MNTTIIKKNRQNSINIKDIKKKHRTILATYYALYAENRHRQKALVTVTIGDERISTLKEYRQGLMKKLNSILRRKIYANQKVQYFANIELGRDQGALTKLFNPHLHIQFFYDDIAPIEEAVEYMDLKMKAINSDVTIPEKEEANYDYAVKEYKPANFNVKYELNKKQLYYKQPLYSCSRKIIPNYVIKFLYKYLSSRYYSVWNTLETYERYDYILEQIKEGNIKIVKNIDRPSDKYITVKNMAIYVNLQNRA